MKNKLKTLINIAPCGLFYLKHTGDDFVFILVNPEAEHVANTQGLSGKPMCATIPGHCAPLPDEHNLTTYEIYRRVAYKEPPYESGYRKARLTFDSPHFNGKAWFDQTVQWVADGEIVIAAINVTEDVKRQEQLYQMAMLDTLCSEPTSPIYTRLYFYTQLNDAVTAWLDKGVISTLLVLDLDKFKSINDTRGHVAGDHMLKTVAQRVFAILPDRCPIARPAGDEFWVMLWGKDINEGYSVGHLICSEISKPAIWVDPNSGTEYELTITASVGAVAICDV